MRKRISIGNSSMESLRIFHGIPFVNEYFRIFLEVTNGLPINFEWISDFLSRQIIVDRNPLEVDRKAIGIPLEILWNSFGNPLEFHWNSFGSPVAFNSNWNS